MSAPKKAVDTATDWKRSRPDSVVYVPKGGDTFGYETDNEHFLVFKAPQSDELLALWTQSGCEGLGNNHLVLARSADGITWSEPRWVAGAKLEDKKPRQAGWEEAKRQFTERQASWGFPVVTAKGRIYVFYTRELEVSDNNRQGSGAMGCLVSDDNGHTFTPGADIPMPRNRFDNPDPTKPKNWIAWQKPIRDSKGRWLNGYTQGTSVSRMTKLAETRMNESWFHTDTRCAFMRFDNIEENPDPRDIRITWLPLDREGLEVPDAMYPEISVSQEPAPVLLPDGRLMTVMRTLTGHVWYSVSENDGDTWSQPDTLRYRDGGDPVKHPLSPCHLFALQNGAYLLFIHNNDGNLGGWSQFEKDPEKLKRNAANCIRNPMYMAVGRFQPKARQPLWFGKLAKILDTQDRPAGPKQTTEIGTYSSLTEHKGQRMLWYPDRKYYLLGKLITDAMLAKKPVKV